uniref:Uncharacterized protein n=1 Tax=Ananas comosus var. bracteatus TaxID=296719 RepID=A0A6V7QIW9_ANACO|nr:unnamed protein product [Ananas comosus var. bracteatus]
MRHRPHNCRVASTTVHGVHRRPQSQYLSLSLPRAKTLERDATKRSTSAPTIHLLIPFSILSTTKTPFSPQNPNRSPLKPHLFASPNPTIHFGRRFGTGDPAADHGKEVDEINLKFAEAREEIEAALESKDTVYFDEEAQCARDAVREVLGLFEGLLARLPERERAALQRSMGLKIEQLKAELKQLDE